ncbi:uncharacterized protein LOC123527094 isoform X2 [Mercenaria mercenaria]|uniref:uncharacterized protein LOC123527094 isoform X2 n=1 Tax=Mercenaria mercenaria TaxID=6596 RepID=UPI00234EC191|nr:uncharacterized protein LOC123527094 isoform X2 [Mercenaria mercenaria]
MDTRNQENSDEGFDDVDGALFSRIPSKQHNIESLANHSLDSTGKDGVDGTLFSRVPSQKDGSTANKAHHRNQIYKPVGDENVTLECSIKPEDLSDTDDDERHPKPEEKESSRSSRGSSCYDDFSDAIQGSRVSLQLEEEPEIQPVASSTFYTQPPLIECDNDIDSTSEHNMQDNGVAFYLQDNETPNGAMLSNGFNQARQITKPKKAEGNNSYEMSHFECDENVAPQNELTLNSTDEKDSSVSPMLNNESKTIKSSNCWQLTKPLIFPVVSLVIYFSDIASDIRLAVSYRENGDINLFWITLSCILIPHVLMAIMDVSWVWLDRKQGHKNTCRLILGGLTLGRIIRTKSTVILDQYRLDVCSLLSM